MWARPPSAVQGERKLAIREILVGGSSMFERYTEKARRVIFFARYEASQFGSPYIETEHILLGLLRENKVIANRYLKPPNTVESIRTQIESNTMIREKTSTSTDLPLSTECKHVLEYAGKEAEWLSHKHIGTEHLLLGLLREEKSFAAAILQERGVHLEAVRKDLANQSQATSQSPAVERSAGGVAIEFLEGDTLVSGSAVFDGIVPAVGDEVVFESAPEAPRSYRVVNVAFIYSPAVFSDAAQKEVPQRLARIVVKVKSSGPSTGRGWAAET
jgi:ATP-dependent Clp protease ATP-binding subunit ClpC